ncbi:MAG: tryptophan synthase subunit alpha [Bryobacterales bacterium]|nr:tryptophan synthase subunit alpha [Bryobacterales bacterium]MDE0292576.1 tryptophan synthase subunit alpha [Bryobacterales bacterium]
MSRIISAFERLRRENNRGLVAYITAGDPSPGHTVELILALEQGGADIIELGVPFSDPIADGPVIQKAGERALRAGTTFPKVLDILRNLRTRSEIPVIIFTYLNPIMRYGFARFASDAAAAGADGALLTDLNIEEAGLYLAEMQKHGLDPVFLVSQTTPDDRLRVLSRSSAGFVYLVSRAGVTGERDRVSDQARRLIERTRRVTDLPLAVGFGLSKPEHMRALAPYADAAVVGSAFMRVIEEHQDAPDLADRMCGLAARLKEGLRIPVEAEDGR